MPSVTFGITSKKINSTSSSMSNQTTLSCRLKEPCGMNEPVFIVSGLSDLHYNYCSWNGRYYWIDEVIFLTNSCKEIHARIDPMATYKTAIENTNAYVMFGDYNHASLFKDDIRFGPDKKRTRPSGETGTGSIDMGFDKTNWTYIITAQCSTSLAYSSVITYAMSGTVFQRVLKGFTGTVQSDIATWSGTDVLDILKNFALKLFTGGGQAIDNIRSAICVPIPLSTFASSAVQSSNVVYIGPYSITLESGDLVYVMNPSWCTKGNSIIYLNRPIASQTYKWLNSPKYCSIQITHPCGYQEINDNSLLENNQLYLWWSLSICSGEYSIRITSETSKDSETIALITGSVGIDVMGIITAGGNNMIDSIFNNTANALNGGVSGGLLGVDTGKMSPSGRGNSVLSGFASIFLLTAGKEVFYDIEYFLPSIFEGGSTEYKDYCDTFGYPVGRYLTLGSLSGFIQCNGATVVGATGATEADKETINSYLNSGFYLE